MESIKKANLYLISSLLLALLLIVITISEVYSGIQAHQLNLMAIAGEVSFNLLCIAFMIAYGIRNRRYALQHSKLLSGPYADLLDDILTCIRSENVSKRDTSLIYDALLDIFVQADHDGRPMDSVIGSNKAAFIDSVLAAHGVQKQRWLDWLLGLQGFLLITLVNQVLTYMRNASTYDFYHTPTYIFSLIFYAVFFICLAPAYMRFRLRRVKGLSSTAKKMKSEERQSMETVLWWLGVFCLLMVLIAFGSYNASFVVYTSPWRIVGMLVLLVIVHMIRRVVRMVNMRRFVAGGK